MRKNLTNQKFGRLIVLGYHETRKQKAYWKCKCSCGNITIAPTSSLKSGNTKSCGCLRKELASKRRIKDLTGKVFGRLTVIKYHEIRYNNAFWECQCECGNTAFVSTTNLKTENTKSCGCLSRENTAKINYTHGHTANRERTCEYEAWSHMRNRCLNPKAKDYPRYGGRGITVCPEWESFEQFLKDMGPKPKGKYSLDRIDTNGNYTPKNCRWATDKQQARNKRNNRLITYKGKTRTLAEWSEVTGIPRYTIHTRIRKLGWPIEKALSTPVRKRKPSNPHRNGLK